MNRAYYSGPISKFCDLPSDQILGEMAKAHSFDLTGSQRDAWIDQTDLLQDILRGRNGTVYLEFSIPRMGKRIDAVLLIGPVIFVLEFKVGQDEFLAADLEQVTDYALDLGNFHEGSHGRYIVPILIATNAVDVEIPSSEIVPVDRLFQTIKTNSNALTLVVDYVLKSVPGAPIDAEKWEESGYRPTPTIIEAALALYKGHSVVDISRSEAGATNISNTSSSIAGIIENAKANSQKAICFVTGVPGAGKTLVGLNIATTFREEGELHSIYLSGNGPLVNILQEALARDRAARQRNQGNRAKKERIRSEVKAFIQNVHHFRDEYLKHKNHPPEHVTIFDEAQRAWNLEKTADFMKRRKKIANFDKSEPEFLISCLDRHDDWAVIICLVGGGQEINTGEAGIGEWIAVLERAFPKWRIFVSDQLIDSEYGAGEFVKDLRAKGRAVFLPELHLSTSIRSFRSEKVSLLVKQILDLDSEMAKRTLEDVRKAYPIVLARDFSQARQWVRTQARGSERYGMLVSSQAERLKPHAVFVKSPINPVLWFLNGKDDVRSSYYLEDVATEFDVQGLELDWTCVAWDADFRYSNGKWQHWSFRGHKWMKIHTPHGQSFLKNAYRVLLTRARQGMVLVVPAGEQKDPTRNPKFYDETFQYLKSLGFPCI